MYPQAIPNTHTRSATNPRMLHTRTKKHKRKTNKALWNAFDTANDTAGSKPPLTISPSAPQCVHSADRGERTACDNCDAPVRVTELGFLACSNPKCGVMFTDTLDRSAEWRYFGDSGGADPTRCGMPVSDLLEQSSYGCKVFVNSRSSHQMRLISRYTEWQSMPHAEKTRYNDFEFIKTMAGNAGIPKIIIDDALRFHKRIAGQRSFRALNRDGIIAASIYIAARINGCPRSAKEIAGIFHLDTTSATKGCKNAITILGGLESGASEAERTKLHTIRPVSFIGRYCSKLGINAELTRVCLLVALKIEKQRLITDNHSDTIAAGVVYFISQVCNLNMCKKDINLATGVSEPSINKCYNKMDAMRAALVPSAILEKYAGVDVE